MKESTGKLMTAFSTWLMAVLHPWALAIRMMFHPLTILFAVPTVLAFYLSVSTEDKQAAAIWVGLSNVFSGILGGILVKLFFDSIDQTIITQRGHLAIRNFYLLINSLGEIRKRVGKYRQIHHEKVIDTMTSIDELCLDEIDARCSLIIEQTLNAVDTWRDIVPMTTEHGREIALFNELKSKVSSLESEINQLNGQLVREKSSSAEVRQTLEDTIRRKTHESEDYKKKLQELCTTLSPISESFFSQWIGAQQRFNLETVVASLAHDRIRGRQNRGADTQEDQS